MKYTIETTENGCQEMIKMDNGKTYTKRHKKMFYGSECQDKEFCDQMENDGFCEEMLEKIYDTFDTFLASEFMDIAKLR